MLISSDSECLLVLDFLEDHRIDALFYSMQSHFSNLESILLFQSRKPPSKPPIYNVCVLCDEKTFKEAGCRAVTLNEFTTQNFPYESECNFEPSATISDTHQLLAFSSIFDIDNISSRHQLRSIRHFVQRYSIGNFFKDWLH